MDLEKYTNSRVYIFFEWSFKLIIWNLLAISIIVVLAGAPMYFFYQSRDNKTVTSVTTNNDEYVVTLHDGKEMAVGKTSYYEEITDFALSDDFRKISFLQNEIIISVVNEDRTIKNINSLFFKDNHLYSKYLDNEYDLGDIYDSSVNVSLSKIDSSNRVTIVLENGTEIIYGNTFNFSSVKEGILVFVAIILALFAFIPTYSTIFSMIKIYGENGHSGTFGLFFDRLWDNFKSLWKLELIVIPFVSLIAIGIYAYFAIIKYTLNPSFFLTISYDILLVCFGIIILFILNIPMTVGYFRMRLKSLLVFTIKMTFRNFLFSLLYLVALALPILLMFLSNVFIPIWFLVGLSVPLLIDYFLINKRYRHMVNTLSVKENTDLEMVEEEN